MFCPLDLPSFFPYGKMKRQITSEQDLGASIRRRRNELELTQGELADVSGVTLRFVSELERGKGTAQFDGIRRVLAALGLNLFVESR
jgi:y4mF family transcriptional regulator